MHTKLLFILLVLQLGTELLDCKNTLSRVVSARWAVICLVGALWTVGTDRANITRHSVSRCR